MGNGSSAEMKPEEDNQINAQKSSMRDSRKSRTSTNSAPRSLDYKSATTFKQTVTWLGNSYYMMRSV